MGKKTSRKISNRWSVAPPLRRLPFSDISKKLNIYTVQDEKDQMGRLKPINEYSHWMEGMERLSV
jgi:hypothetical protein